MTSSLLVLLFAISSHAADFVPLTTPKGAKILVTLSVPEGKAGPLVVFAPGQGCGERPIYDLFAEEASRAGLAVARFQYAYCLRGEAGPKDDSLGEEVDAFRATVAYAKKKHVDGTRVAFVGKSLGSMVAYCAFRAEKRARALLLLTPICTYPKGADEKDPTLADVFDEDYPSIAEEARPLALLWGDDDRLCKPAVLFSHLRTGGANALPMLFPGDHGFTLKNADGTLDEAASAENQRAVARFAARYLARTLKEKQ